MDKGNVILIESNDFARASVEASLKKEGFNVIGVSNSASALEKAKESKFEIIIAEMNIPDMNKQIEVIRKLKEINSESCVIVATTYDSIVAAVTALKEGAYDYVVKPFNFEELSLVVEKALEWKQLQSTTRQHLKEQDKTFYDFNTGVYNYRYFQETLKIEINRVLRYPSYVSFLFIDVDNLELYEKEYGKEKTNNLIKDIGQLFWKYTRKTDYVTRYIHNEFAIILPETKKDGAFVLASRMSAVVRETTFPDEKGKFSGKITVSIGIVTCPNDAKSAGEIIQKAELALAQARKLGRDRIVMF